MNHLKSPLEKLADHLIEGEMEINCSRITLTQQTKEESKVKYSGHGRITQSKDGKFKIQIIFTLPPKKTAPPMTSSDLHPEIKIGEIYPTSVFFTAKCLSVEGELWTGKDVWLEADFYHPTRTAVLKGECEKLESKSKRINTNNRHCMTICKTDDFRMPRNKFTDYGDHGKTRNISFFTIGLYRYKITTHTKHTEFEISSEKNISQRLIDGSLHAFEILSGTPLVPVLQHQRQRGSTKTTICSPDNNMQTWKLPPPLPNRHPLHLENCVSFIDALIKQHNTSTPKFYNYWREIGFAQITSIESFALCVSVNVEGMINRYFSNLRSPDPDFVAECQNSIAYLDTLLEAAVNGPITQRVKDKILRSLENTNGPSAKNALYKLFKKDPVDNWNRIRHPAAHGALAEKQLSEQTLFDCSYSCLYMFYSMIMHQIQFKGERINYSLKEYPTYSPL